MKKRLLALALVLVMVLGLAACGKDKGDPNEIVIGDYTAYYTGAKVVEDSDGDDAIAIFFDFTNNSEEAASFLWSMYYKATQNGTELEDCTVFLSEDSFDTLFDSSMEDVAPGETLEVALTYKLADPAAAVEIDFSDLFDKEKDHLTIDMATVKPADAAPAEEAEETEETEEEAEEPAEGDKGGKFGKDEPENYAFDAAFAAGYAGDWHGVAEFYDCTGDYSDEDEMQCDIAARLVFDEDGYCTPYIRLCLDQPEEENLIVESLSYDEEYDCILINGTLNEKPLDPVESFIELEGEDVLYIGAEYDDGSGDVFKILGCLRRLDDQWDYENDYPYIVQEGVDFYMGMSFEERIELFGYDTSLIPELSGNVASDAQEDEEEPAEDAGEGVVELQQLKDWKAWHKETNSNANNYYKPTIDECVEAMGVEPAAWSVEKWEEDVQMFKWTTPDGKDHIILTIKPDDSGTWRYHSISWSSGVNG